LRLFRRDVGRYQPRWVHAEVDLDDSRTRRLKTAFLHYTTWTTDEYLNKLNRYAAWGALNFRDEEGRTSAGFWQLFTRAPLRFIQLYFFRLGFLDGIPGLQVCAFTAFYSFLKQAKLWEASHAIPQPIPEDEQEDEEIAIAGSIMAAQARRGRNSPSKLRRAA
jgi:hypothetical protein